MNHVHDTWYVLEDGSKADPNDVAPDDNGMLRHKSGVAVAMRGSVPRTSGVGPAAVEPAGGGEAPTGRDVAATAGAPASDDRQMKPAATGKGYHTRAGKAD